MSTASTKRRARKATRAQADDADASTTASDAAAFEPSGAPNVPEGAWRISAGVILGVAALVRLWSLEINPLHHDEGVNGWFLTNLVRNYIYQYNPTNYHGPTLYYFTLVPAFILEKVLGVGMSTFMLRAVPALFGLATVWLVLQLRRYIGTFGALAAAALVAVSPGAVYQSRYFIHETLFVFFTLGIVVAALRYYETARALYLMLAFASAALLFATKETAFISAGVLALAWGVAWAWTRAARAFGWRGRETAVENARTTARKPSGKRAKRAASAGALERFGGASHVALLLIGGLALFALINVLFYSSFFTYAEGVRGAVESLQIWTKTGNKDHTKPFDTYLNWLQQEETPIYLLAVLGAVWSLLRRAPYRFAVFAGAWAFGMLVAYSLVPYKTPWLALNFIVPMAISGGYALNEMFEWAGGAKVWRALTLAVALAAVGVCTYQTVALNFFHYDDDRYPYVYAHTRREYLQLVNEVERLAKLAGTGRQTPIAIASPDYWPSPWYFRDYPGVGYLNELRPFTEPIVIGKDVQEAQLDALLAATHERVGTVYPLRPGVNLLLYARRDLVKPSLP